MIFSGRVEFCVAAHKTVFLKSPSLLLHVHADADL